MGTVTLSLQELQELLQAQTSQLEGHLTSQVAALQATLEKSFDEKLHQKFEQAENNVKRFMKESIEEEDLDDDLKFLKDHVLQMEQSVSRITHAPMPLSSEPRPVEQIVADCCARLEEMIQQRTAKSEQGRNNPRRSQSMDAGPGGLALGGLTALRASQKHMEDFLESRMKNLEQFIDSRHAELEAYYSSSTDNLKKVIVETVLGINNNNHNNNGSNHSNHHAQSNPLTREDLEAILDSRIRAECAEEAEAPKPLTREELEAVLDASKPLTREELEAVLDARISAEETQQEQERQAATSQVPPESSNTNGSKSLYLAMEKLIQQQQEWIELQSSTIDLEQQVQFKLDQLEDGNPNSISSSLKRVESKLQSLEKLALAGVGAAAAAAANGPPKRRRPTGKKNAKKLSQLMDGHGRKANHDGTETTKARMGDADATVQVTTPFSDVSVDDRGIDDDDDEEEQQGGRVKSFLNTFHNWKELTERQDQVVPQQPEEDSEGENDVDLDLDIDEGDDDIDSNASMSADSSAKKGGGGIGTGDKVIKILQRLESTLGQLEEKLPLAEAVAPLSIRLDGAASQERSTNARHSREILVNTDSIEQSIRAEHTKLKQWILEQQDEIAGSNRLSDSGRSTGGDLLHGQRKRAAADGATGTIDPRQLATIQEKLNAIESLVSTNQSFLQEQRRQAVPPVPQELPLVQPLGGSGTLDLERKILNHLDTMDASVQCKLDEIFGQVQLKMERQGDDWSGLSQLDQSGIIATIDSRLQEIKEAIIVQLRESIPDYGAAKSVIVDALEDMRQIVSEIAISEVGILKAQLGVAEEAEQEALHAILVMKEQMEEFKEAERRARYSQPQPQQGAASKQPGGGLWNFGPLGQLLGQQLPPPSSMVQRVESRKLSIGHQGHSSGNLHESTSRGLNYNSSTVGSLSQASKYRSPKQKLEDWKNQIAYLDDKATDLRMVYSELRGQKPDGWTEKSSLKGSSQYSGGETKEMEVEVSLPALQSQEKDEEDEA